MTTESRHINRWQAFALLAVAYFMTIVDLTIVNVSLPTIGRDLHFSRRPAAVDGHRVCAGTSAAFCCSAVGRRICSVVAGC